VCFLAAATAAARLDKLPLGFGVGFKLSCLCVCVSVVRSGWFEMDRIERREMGGRK